jgi:lysophospholipid acyltransferase (LPLAT)-like uncharacterized protein
MPTFPQGPRKSGVVKPHGVTWTGRLLAWLIWLAVKLCGATIRFTFEDHSGLLAAGPRERPPFIICLWHNRLSLALRLREKALIARGIGRPMAALVSASRDGGLLSRVLERAGVQPVRGSSSRRGAQALLELKHWSEQGYDITITPDGPRGPCQVVQNGVIGLAQVTGLPILPVNYHLDWKWTLKSWDRFQIPIPFSRCRVVVGKSMQLPEDTDDETREFWRKRLEEQMNSILDEPATGTRF